MRQLLRQTTIALALVGTLALSAQQTKTRKNKFEIALGVNAVDVYSYTGWGEWWINYVKVYV